MAEIAVTSFLNDASLKAYYRLESGALTTDSSTGGVTLTNNNTVGETTGKYGGAANFGTPNTNKYLSAVNNLGIDGDAITISLWAKILTTPGTDTTYCLAMQANDNTDTFYGIYYQDSSGTKQVGYKRARQNVAYYGPDYEITLDTSGWYHFVLTYDNTSVRGYLNGVLVAGPTATTGNGSANAADRITIGVEYSTALVCYSPAYIDDVAFFSRCLSDSEISQLYVEGSGFFALL